MYAGDGRESEVTNFQVWMALGVIQLVFDWNCQRSVLSST